MTDRARYVFVERRVSDVDGNEYYVWRNDHGQRWAIRVDVFWDV